MGQVGSKVIAHDLKHGLRFIPPGADIKHRLRQEL